MINMGNIENEKFEDNVEEFISDWEIWGDSPLEKLKLPGSVYTKLRNTHDFALALTQKLRFTFNQMREVNRNIETLRKNKKPKTLADMFEDYPIAAYHPTGYGGISAPLGGHDPLRGKTSPLAQAILEICDTAKKSFGLNESISLCKRQDYEKLQTIAEGFENLYKDIQKKKDTDFDEILPSKPGKELKQKILDMIGRAYLILISLADIWKEKLGHDRER